MVKRIVFFLIVLTLFSALVLAEECQYTESIVVDTISKILPFDNEGNQLKDLGGVAALLRYPIDI